MKQIAIYWNDLTPKKQQELLKEFGGENGNYDTMPIATIDIEDGSKDKADIVNF